MRKQTIFLFLIAAISILSSCNKEKIEEPLPEEQAVFLADGSIGSETFSIKAGENNFYMHTFTTTENGVSLFSGKLSNNDFELEMGIFDGNLDLPSSTNPQDIPNSISFANESTSPLAILSKNLLPNNQFIQEIKWYINGVFTGINEVEIMQPGKYNVCAVVTFNDGSSGNLCNDMILGFIKHATCKVRHFLGQEGNLQTWVEEDQVPISSVKWFLDGVNVSNDLKLFATINDSNHKVTAEITFENGVKRTKSILVDGSLSGKFIDDFSVFEVNSNTFNWDFKARVSLKKDGKTFLSNKVQNQISTINISNITYFGLNSSGKMVFKITAEISCLMKEMSTNTIVPFSCNTVFGLEMNQ